MAASGRVGYAVVGLGHFAEHVVLPGFRNSRKAKLVALVSGDERKARRLAGRFGASDYYDYDDYALCLNHPHVDAVYVATNNSTHAEFTLKAAAAGKHVLCEKPMANSVEECQQMIDACRANHVRLMIAYRKYFEPASLDLKMLVEKGQARPAEDYPLGVLDLSAPRAEGRPVALRPAAGGRGGAARCGRLLHQHRALGGGQGTAGGGGLPVDRRPRGLQRGG